MKRMISSKTVSVLFGFVLVLVSAMGAWAQYSGGVGDATSPYLISTTADWELLIVTTSDWNTGKYFVLTADLDFEGANITRVGDNATPFNGVLDGAGYIISNATIEHPDVDYVGFIGYLDMAGEIKNLRFENMVVMGKHCVGGLVGWSQGAIADCSVIGMVNGADRVGELVGQHAHGTVTNCYTAGVVDANFQVGGLIGRQHGGTIANCYATGVVNGSDYVGGLVGYQSYDETSGTITNCYATSTVNGHERVGGLVGYQASGMVIHCFAIGAVSGNVSVGGLIGNQWGGMVSVSYWNTETSGQSSSAGGTSVRGCTTAEMTYPYSSNTYRNWDFDTEWSPDPMYAYNHGYPFPRWGLLTVGFETDGTAGAVIEGTTWQVLTAGADCTPVTAVEPLGYSFVRWASATDTFATTVAVTVTNVTENLSLIAEFAEDTPTPTNTPTDTPTATPTPLNIADINEDGRVDALDLFMFVGRWQHPVEDE